MRRTNQIRARRHRAGVALLEVIVASGLLIIGVVPILKALTTAQVTSRLVDQKTHCLTLAQAKMNEIAARSIGNFETSYAETGTSLDGNYLGNVTDNGHASLKTISVAVGHDHDGNGSITGREIMVTLTTLMAKRL
jgi:Tfp pilus assembly protein PilV